MTEPTFCFAHLKRLNHLYSEERLSQRQLAEVHLEMATRCVVSHLGPRLERASQREKIGQLLGEVLLLACMVRCNNSFSAGSVLYHWPQEVILAAVAQTNFTSMKRTGRVWREFAQEFFDGTFSAASRSMACDAIDYLTKKSCTLRDVEAFCAVSHCIQCLTPAMRKSLNSQRRRGGLHISG